MQLIVNGLLTSYVRTGRGKQVLVLHGWGDNSAGWAQFANRLSERFEVIVPDLPGFGGTQSPPEAWGLDDYVGFIAAFIKKTGIEPFAIVGHSNGGAIAVRGLARKHLAASKLILLASAGVRGEYKGRNKALRIVTKTGKFLTAPLPASVKRKLRRKVYTTVGSDMLVAEHLQETFKRVVTDDVRADAAGLVLPALLVYGDRDDQAPLRYGQAFHEAIKGSKLVVVPGADHFLQYGHLAEIVKLVKEFLT